MKLLQLCIIGIVVLVGSACQSPQQPKFNKQLQYGNAVSEQLAQQRSQRVSQVSYRVELDLTQASSFSGKADIQFYLSDKSQALVLDLNQARISQFSINGSKIYPNYNGKSLIISQALLSSGSNQVSVQYTKPYSQSDEGLIRYTDPSDGQAYIYSHFLPSSAQMMMPLFDQPDLKAAFSLSVSAPKDWQVISASTSKALVPGEASTLWQFATTNSISPHSFSLHAGPYKHWQTTVEKLPLNLYARQSIATNIDGQQWLQQTTEAILFYQQQFGVIFPFNKYDQLIVPKLPIKAMSNAAVSTFDESLLETEALQLNQLSTLAEQWVSNTISLPWWDELWLSQSLARFMAKKARVGTLEIPAWYQDKHNVYQVDDRRNSRPIEAAVVSSLEVEDGLNQDKIDKGIALLTQLNFLLGEKAFNQGLKRYLEQHRFGTASVDDFIVSLSHAAKRPLDEWSKNWLYQSGVNSIRAVYQCSNDRISQFSLQQTAIKEHPVLREQKVKVGLFTLGRQGLYRNQSIAVTYKGANTEVKRLHGSRCPDLVFPNYQDWGYVKVELDPNSLETTLMNLSKIEDPQFRIMLWQTLWDSVLSGDISLKRFIGSVMINAPQEQDPQVLPHLLNKLRQTKALLEQISPNQRSYSQRALKAMEQMSLRLTMSSTPESPLQTLWFDNYVQFATSFQAKQHLAALLEGTEQLPGIELNQARRWAMIIHLNRYDYLAANRLVIQEKQQDSSSNGQMLAIDAEVSQPRANQKRQWFERVQQHTSDGDSINLPKLIGVMQHLYPSEQKALSMATAEQRLAQLAELDKNNSSEFMRIYSQYMLPMDCSYSGVSRLMRLQTSEQDFSPTTQQGIAKAIQNEQRCVMIKEQLDR
ncbi:aminopeptidase N [Shewanella sp. Isolate11]|uniref:aminopeptidase N n=1 Tax=Shewanella sp. Isolate11 TaxID=2908530 RepID=UPI001EFD1B32|nr:aminopeptidase N [Shewanella sp. Isolate11]MCG9695778.1 aminopeptidase N [Shewanella sp. Isolate11]